MIMKIGKFTVQANLGTGAHSSILQVRRAEDSRTYALKVVNIDEPEDMRIRTSSRRTHWKQKRPGCSAR